MKKRNLITLAILSTFALNAVAETSLIVKPIGEYTNGTDIGGGYKRISVDSELSQDALVKLYEDTGLFQSVEIDTLIQKPITFTKKQAFAMQKKSTVQSQSVSSIDDPYFILQKYLHSSSEYINGTNLQAAADYLLELKGKEGNDVRVLVVDGAFYENPEVPIEEGYSFSSFRDDGLSSRPQFYAVEPAGECTDEHGTAIASIYGALRDNGESIAGATPNVTVVAAEALVCGTGSISDVIRSIYWGLGEKVGDAVNISKPVDIINLSLGTMDSCSTSFQSALNFARTRGVQIHVSAGNDGVDANLNTPGNCDNVMVTGALDINTDTPADFSNTGDTVDVYAEGVDILGLDSTEGSVSYWNGTSFAVSLTGSTGALLKSYYPDIKPEQSDWFISQSTRKLSNSPVCESGNCEKGQIDALAAAKRAEEYFSHATSTIKPALAVGEACLSGYVGTYFTKEFKLCGLYEVSFESQTDKSGKTYQLYATPKTGGEPYLVMETPEVSVMTREIDLQNFSYHYSVCTNGECVDSPLVFAIDRTTPLECQ